MLMLDKDGAVADLVLADAALYEAYADKDADRLTEVNKTVSDPDRCERHISVCEGYPV